MCLRKIVALDNDTKVELKRRLQEKYAEFLSLPLTLEEPNPLNFVVVMIFDGERLWSGWRAEPRIL